MAETTQNLRATTEGDVVLETPGFDTLHLWWGLSYAQYLTIPRSVMQSMPDEWQAKMAALLNELDETIDWRPDADHLYWVELVEAQYDRLSRITKGRKKIDPFWDYERGRRRIPHKISDPAVDSIQT